MHTQNIARCSFLYLCRLGALLVVILAIKVWLARPATPSTPSPMNSTPVQLLAHLGKVADRT